MEYIKKPHTPTLGEFRETVRKACIVVLIRNNPRLKAEFVYQVSAVRKAFIEESKVPSHVLKARLKSEVAKHCTLDEKAAENYGNLCVWLRRHGMEDCI